MYSIGITRWNHHSSGIIPLTQSLVRERMGLNIKTRHVIILLIIILIAYCAYKGYFNSSSEGMDAGTTLDGDICSDGFRINEELRVSVVGKGQFQRWYLTKDGMLNIQQGAALPGGKQFRVDKVLSKKFSNTELEAIRKLYKSQAFHDVYSGFYRPDVTTLDTTLCNPKDKGWVWTYRTIDRCISVECQGRKLAMDAVQGELLRLSASIPGFSLIST